MSHRAVSTMSLKLLPDSTKAGWFNYRPDAPRVWWCQIWQSRAEAPQAGIKQGLMSLQLSCRPWGKWFLPWQSFYCAANHCISPLLSTHPGAMSTGWWRWDWLYTWIGDGHLQPPLCSDKMALCLRAHPPLSLLLGRYLFLTQISDQVSLVPKHSLRITCHTGWWWPGKDFLKIMCITVVFAIQAATSAEDTGGQRWTIF